MDINIYIFNFRHDSESKFFVKHIGHRYKEKIHAMFTIIIFTFVREQTELIKNKTIVLHQYPIN